MVRRSYLTLTLTFLLSALLGDANTQTISTEKPRKHTEDPSRILVLDGSNVHNVGELWIHVGNWGLFGSWPGSGSSFSHAPSAEWPAGSGIEYLFASGLWVGAIKNGIPSVSTSTFESELRPTQDPIDIIYRSKEGAANGIRYPNPNANDDGDGQVDEDRLDGHDNDLDGLIDEDFAAISDQMFSCWYRDDTPTAASVYPQHRPLGISVFQESYQWKDDRFDDFVGISYTIENTGVDILHDVYLGFFVDPDCGNRNVAGYGEDDSSGFLRVPTVCTETGPVSIEMAYAFDFDRDRDVTTGYVGALLLGHTTSDFDDDFPSEVRVSTYANFAGGLSYENGGDPTNDFERYELMSQQTIERDAFTPRDYRFLITVGPFDNLRPNKKLEFQVAIVVGEGLQGLRENAAAAAQMFKGGWFDVDRDPLTGIDGRETRVVGPAEQVFIDACRSDLNQPIPVIPRGESVWVNFDCEEEAQDRERCNYTEADSLLFQTGVAGRETHVPWFIEGVVETAIDVSLDIKPGSCPNAFNITWTDNIGNGQNDNPKIGGVLPVAIAGADGFDASAIDPSTVRLEGVAPLRASVSDVTSPVDAGCECQRRGPDGIDDLAMKFSRQELAAAIGPASDRDIVSLTVTGTLMDGTTFEGSDCVLLHTRERRTSGPAVTPDTPADAITDVTLGRAEPNPFNPVTRISFAIPSADYVRLSVYNVTGALVERLVDGRKAAGTHTVTWDATKVPSGIYFYQLESGGTEHTRKMILLK